MAVHGWPAKAAAGLMRLAVCAEMVFTDLPFTERVRRIHDAGFDVELWDSRTKDLSALKATGCGVLLHDGIHRGQPGGPGHGRRRGADGRVADPHCPGAGGEPHGGALRGTGGRQGGTSRLPFHRPHVEHRGQDPGTPRRAGREARGDVLPGEPQHGPGPSRHPAGPRQGHPGAGGSRRAPQRQAHAGPVPRTAGGGEPDRTGADRPAAHRRDPGGGRPGPLRTRHRGNQLCGSRPGARRGRL